MSTEQFGADTPRQLPTEYEQESYFSSFYGGTLYNDAATGIIWVENQVSLGARETFLWKERFEQWIWDQVCVEISHVHAFSISH